MADINKTIAINFEGETGKLKRKLREIPLATKKAAVQMAKEFDENLKKSEKQAKRTSKAFKKNFGDAAKGAAIVGAAILAAGVAVVAFGQKLADLNNQLTDAAARSGIATDTLAGLRLAAEGSGLAFDSLQRGLDRLPTIITELKNGTKGATEAFKNIGITIDQVVDKSPDEIFVLIADRIGKITDPAERSAAAIKLFGQQAGAALIQTGALENLESFVSLATQFGVDVGPAAAEEAAHFQRAAAELSTVLQGVGSDLLSLSGESLQLSDAIFAVTDSIVFMSSVFMSGAEAIGIGFKSIGKFVAANVLEFKALGTVIGLTLQGEFKKAEQTAEAYGGVINGMMRDSIDLIPEGLAVLGDSFDVANRKLNTLNSARAKVLSQKKPSLLTADKDDDGSGTGTTAAKQALDLERARAKVQSMYQAAFAASLEGEAAILHAHSLQIAALQKIQLESDNLVDTSIARSELEYKLESDLAEFRTQKAAEDKARRDRANEDIKRKAQEQLQLGFTVAESMGATAASVSSGVLTIMQNTDNASRKQLIRAHAAMKAASMAEIAINTAIGVSNVWAKFGYAPPVAAALTAGVVATGAVQLGVVGSQPAPKFDVGGMVGRSSGPDSVTSSLLSGEAVLDRATVRRIGGEDGVRDLQKGNNGSQVIVIQPFKHFDKFIRSELRRDGSLRSAIKPNRPIGAGAY